MDIQSKYKCILYWLLDSYGQVDESRRQKYREK